MVKFVKFLNEFVVVDYRIFFWLVINIFYFIYYDKLVLFYRKEVFGLFVLVFGFFFRFLNGFSDK